MCAHYSKKQEKKTDSEKKCRIGTFCKIQKKKKQTIILRKKLHTTYTNKNNNDDV